MTEYWLGIATAAWLGFLCSISPCPLATNIAAISFVSCTDIFQNPTFNHLSHESGKSRIPVRGELEKLGHKSFITNSDKIFR